jgi:Spy/CpxP family protein refolding chaperone
MICLAVGLGILGAIAFRRARRCHRGGYGWHGPWAGHGGDDHDHHGWHGRHGGHGRHGRRRWMLHAMLARIDATPAQERVIVGEIDKLRERMVGSKETLRDARGDLAAAMRGPVLDDAALGAVLGRLDAATGDARGAAIEALRNVHAVLDEKQRAQVAEMLDRGGGWWRGGPYR